MFSWVCIEQKAPSKERLRGANYLHSSHLYGAHHHHQHWHAQPRAPALPVLWPWSTFWPDFENPVSLWLPTDNHFETLSSEFLDNMVVRIWFVLELITFHPPRSDVNLPVLLAVFWAYTLFFSCSSHSFLCHHPLSFRFQKLNLFAPL